MNKKILIVDDEPDICNLISELLKDMGFDTLIASTGIEALNQAEQTPLDLIILDIHLPDIDGVVVYERIRCLPSHAKTPVVFLTALASGTNPKLATATHADYSIIPKPVSLDRIQRMVTETLGKQ